MTAEFFELTPALPDRHPPGSLPHDQEKRPVTDHPNPAPDPPVSGPLSLFDLPGETGANRAAMEASLATWHRAGTVVSDVERITLLSQAEAIDRALASGRSTAVTGATRAMLELLAGFGLLSKANPPSPDEVFAKWAAEMDDSDAAP